MPQQLEVEGVGVDNWELEERREVVVVFPQACRLKLKTGSINVNAWKLSSNCILMKKIYKL